MFSISLLILSLYPIQRPTLIKEIIKLTILIVIELLTYSGFRGLKGTINALRLMMFFIFLGITVYFISIIMGWAPLSPVNVLIGSLYLIVLFIALSMFLQLISVKEWRWILRKIGFKNYSLMFTMVLSQIPVLIFYASEAFTTTRLKYGAKKLYKFVVPLILLAITTSRNTLEAYTIYGASSELKLSLYRRKDWALYVVLAISITMLLSFSIIT
ncbi:MAG: hypothetical protein QXE81_05475 [Desulfurococcaceae archaeon]